MTDTDFHVHPVRGPFNAVFFWLAEGMFDHLLGPHKRRLLADLPDTVVELGSGVGANLRYLAPGSSLIAVEPNPAMHRRLRRAARRRGVHLDVRQVPAERTDLPDASAEVVVSSLVLCTVADVDRVLAEVRRVLRPGGRFVFVEHVAAPEGTRAAPLAALGPGAVGVVLRGLLVRARPRRGSALGRVRERRRRGLSAPVTVPAVQPPDRRRGDGVIGRACRASDRCRPPRRACPGRPASRR